MLELYETNSEQKCYEISTNTVGILDAKCDGHFRWQNSPLTV